MKVGIIGINIHTFELNPGAVLHAWAFSHFFRNFQQVENVEIIDYIPEHVKDRIGPYPFIKYLKKGYKRVALQSLTYAHAYKKRYDKFYKFVRKNLHVSDKQYDRKSLSESELDYDLIIVESDVVWDRICNGEFEPTFFLSLPSMKSMKRIAYSVDVGALELIDSQIKESMESLLLNIDHISCRNEHAKHIIEQCTNQPVTVLQDPTLMIDVEKYDTICSPKKRQTPYLLCYYIDYDVELINAAQEYAKRHNLKYVEITSRITNQNYRKFSKKLYALGVDEFVSEIKYADCIMTNSFHAICVSIQYKKQFFAFPRKKEKKVKELCEKFEVTERYIVNQDIDDSHPIDYKNVDRILNEERKISIDWLNKALEN